MYVHIVYQESRVYEPHACTYGSWYIPGVVHATTYQVLIIVGWQGK